MTSPKRTAPAPWRRSVATVEWWPSSPRRRTWCPADQRAGGHVRRRHRCRHNDAGERLLRRRAIDGCVPRRRDLAISEDGRFVAFPTNASNLVPNDTNNTTDVFVHDLSRNRQNGSVSPAVAPRPTPALPGYRSAQTGGSSRSSRARRCSPFVGDGHPGQAPRNDQSDGVTSGGQPVNTAANGTRISADGRFVAFFSAAQLVANDTNTGQDAYWYDRQTTQLTLVSVTMQETAGTEHQHVAPDRDPGRDRSETHRPNTRGIESGA